MALMWYGSSHPEATVDPSADRAGLWLQRVSTPGFGTLDEPDTGSCCKGVAPATILCRRLNALRSCFTR